MHVDAIVVCLAIVVFNYCRRVFWSKLPTVLVRWKLKLKLPKEDFFPSVNHVRICVRMKNNRELTLSWLYAGFILPCRVTRAEQQPMAELELRSRQRWTWPKKREWNYCYCALPRFLPDDALLDGCFITFLTLQ